MKKKILRLTVAAVLIAAAVGLLILCFSGNQLTVARCVVTEGGSLYMVYDDSPVLLTSVGERDYRTGDKLLILHANAFAESYPEQARAVFVCKIASGTEEDVPQKVYDVLIETGNWRE